MSIVLKDPPADLKAKFLSLNTHQDLADLLDVSLKKLMYHARVCKPSAKYTNFNVAKKSGGQRIISAPATALKILQRKLNQVLTTVYEPKPSVHGFTTDRSVVSNAKIHAGAKFLLNVDLKDFFPSINFGRVRGLFMAKPYGLNADVATLLAQLACDGSLPQGAPTSPVISNMICAKMDAELQRLAQRFHCRYTRYADDLSFSTFTNSFPKALARLVSTPAGEQLEVGSELEKVIIGNGFAQNQEKVRLQTRQKRQQVTGLTVNEFPNVTRRYVSQLRAMLHAWETFGLENAQTEFLTKYDQKRRNPMLPPPSFVRVVKGKLDFLRMVRGKDDSQYIKLLRQYARLAPNFSFTNLVCAHDNLSMIRDALWVLETAETSSSFSQGTAFALAGVGLVTCAHVIQADTEAFRPNLVNKRYPVTVLAIEPTIDLAVIAPPVPLEVQLVRGDPTRLIEADPVSVYGFPNYRLGDQGLIHRGAVTGFRIESTIRRVLVDAHIVEGNSGGPVLDKNNRVGGVAVTGADSFANVPTTEKHAMVPIDALLHLKW
jgi:RNA-directed DNA polymerase